MCRASKVAHKDAYIGLPLHGTIIIPLLKENGTYKIDWLALEFALQPPKIGPESKSEDFQASMDNRQGIISSWKPAIFSLTNSKRYKYTLQNGM